MLGGATTSDIGQAERMADICFAGLPAFLEYDLDNFRIRGGSENSLQLLLGRLT